MENEQSNPDTGEVVFAMYWNAIAAEEYWIVMPAAAVFWKVGMIDETVDSRMLLTPPTA